MIGSCQMTSQTLLEQSFVESGMEENGEIESWHDTH